MFDNRLWDGDNHVYVRSGDVLTVNERARARADDRRATLRRSNVAAPGARRGRTAPRSDE
jgi:hypothetical protein